MSPQTPGAGSWSYAVGTAWGPQDFGCQAGAAVWGEGRPWWWWREERKQGRGYEADLGPRRTSGPCQRYSHRPRQGWKGWRAGWSGVYQILLVIHSRLSLAQPNGRHGYRNSTSPQQSEGRRGMEMHLRVRRQVSCLPGRVVSLPWKSGVLRGLSGCP